jgi:hypothetical protein
MSVVLLSLHALATAQLLGDAPWTPGGAPFRRLSTVLRSVVLAPTCDTVAPAAKAAPKQGKHQSQRVS